MSTLADRYASPAMKEIWSAQSKILAERRLWIAVMRFQSKALSIPESAITDYEKAAAKIDLSSIEKRERELHHDVKARIEEFNSLSGHEYLHIGMTSRDVTENIEMYQIKNSLDLVANKTLILLKVLSEKIMMYKNFPIVGRTHNVPAQVTTLGRKFAYWAEDLLFAYENLENLQKRLPLKGINGAVGTRLDLLSIVDNNYSDLVEKIQANLGVNRTLIAPSQVYPRSIDFEVVSVINQLAMSPNNIALNIRLLSGFNHVSEHFTRNQIGSSAMPHKINPRLSERINSLFIVLKGFLTMAAENGGNQWNEGDVSCSAARRVFLPDSFMALDAILETSTAVTKTLMINEKSIEEELSVHLPELSSTSILMMAVKQGVGRETAYSRIRDHFRLANIDKLTSGKNTFFERILGDDLLNIKSDSLSELLKFPLLLTGDSEAQSLEIIEVISTKLAGTIINNEEYKIL